jgi:hypothetical protein
MLGNDNIFCENCDRFKKEKQNLWICLNCKETFCSDCEKEIHRKSRRLLHQRILANEKFYKSIIEKSFTITFFTSEFYSNNFSEERGINFEIKERIYQKLVEETKKGRNMTKIEDIISYLLDFKLSLNEQQILDLLFPPNEDSKFLITYRSFGTAKGFKYISLKLSNVSLEIIVSILKSIAIDKMEPKYILIHSRLKEFHGLEISMPVWKEFIKELYHNESKYNLNKYSDYIGKLEIFLSNEEGNILLKPENKTWNYDDMQTIEEEDEDYKIYLKCMQNFFEKENDENFEFFFKNPDKWNFSSSMNQSSKFNLFKMMQEKGITKAIPGGKYGCALMLKYLYEEDFKNVSIGKLNAMIKTSFDKQIYTHKKTLIRKNENPEKFSQSEKHILIEKAKKTILDILKARGETGISLSELPLCLKSELGDSFNFVDLGFPQLKNFIDILSEQIILVKSDNNHIRAKLKNIDESQNNNENYLLESEIQKRKFSMNSSNISKSKNSQNPKEEKKFKRKGINIQEYKNNSMINSEDMNFTNLTAMEEIKRNNTKSSLASKQNEIFENKSPYYVPTNNNLENGFIFKKILMNILNTQEGIELHNLEKLVKFQLTKKGILKYDYQKLSFLDYLKNEFSDIVFFAKNGKLFLNYKSCRKSIHYPPISKKRKNSFADGFLNDSKADKLERLNSRFSSGNTTPFYNCYPNDYYQEFNKPDSPEENNLINNNLKQYQTVFNNSNLKNKSYRNENGFFSTFNSILK